MKRILFLIDELDIGGTEQQILELSTGLNRRRFNPMVCCFRPGRVAEEIQAAGVPVFTIPKRSKFDPVLIFRLWKLYRRERIDLLQTYLFTANTWGRVAAILSGVPAVISSERNIDMWEPRYKRWISLLLDRWTQCTIANSQAVKDYLVRKKLPAQKVEVISNGVDLDRFEDHDRNDQVFLKEIGIPSGHQVVVFLARLEPQKDPSTFLKAAASLSGCFPKVTFLVIGEGSLRNALREQAADLNLDQRVVFAGPRRDISRLLAASDLSVLPSLKEGMSNTIMESMASGIPTVATKVGGNSELIKDGQTGLLVDPRNPEQLAAAVGKLLSDPNLKKAMGLRARQRAQRLFSSDVMVNATERLYDRFPDSVQTFTSGEYRDRRSDRPSGYSIAFVVSQFPRFVDAYFLREITHLARRGIRFQILSLRDFHGKILHDDARELLTQTIYVPYFFSIRILIAQLQFLVQHPLRYFGALTEIVIGYGMKPTSFMKSLAVFPKSVYFAKLVQDQKISHVHANWATHPATSSRVISRLTGKPWSFFGHASDIYLDTTMLVDKIRTAKFVATCTRHNKEYLASLAGRQFVDKIHVCYHGVDLKKFIPGQHQPRSRFRILAVGSLIACKGFSDLIDACKILANQGVSFECTIVGDGVLRQTLEEQIDRLGLADWVKITGYVTQESIIPLYQQSSVVVLPALSARHFGIPNVLLEALATETPVICTALPSLSEFFEDKTVGLYVPERCPQDLAKALESLVENPARCMEMGRMGRRKIESMFDAEANAEKLERLLLSGDDLQAHADDPPSFNQANGSTSETASGRERICSV